MTDEKTKMLAGQPYNAGDPQLALERKRARTLCDAYNHLPVNADGERSRVLAELFGRAGDPSFDAKVTAPFRCDYGTHIDIGSNAYFNYDCVILDVCRVTIGNDTLFGPGVHIYAASHPMTVAARRTGLESGAPVSIGNDVWVGGRAIILPGVAIGARSVIGAGSIVTKDVPAGVFAAGNPCRVIHTIDENR